jgi:hypothetical protein
MREIQQLYIKFLFYLFYFLIDLELFLVKKLIHQDENRLKLNF